jgi:replicative DNA helicase
MTVATFDGLSDVEHLDLVIARAGPASAASGFAFTPGGEFVLDQPAAIPALWGTGDRVVWARGEALMIVGPAGVGKTTLAQQVVLARVGLTRQVLDLPVEPTSSRVLYLACDRPPQIARSLARMCRPADREQLDERLVVWKGPPPRDLAKHPTVLLDMAQAAGADTVVVDSLKDVALKITER